MKLHPSHSKQAQKQTNLLGSRIWFDRFSVSQCGAYYKLKDSLYSDTKLLPIKDFSKHRTTFEQRRELFRAGFLEPCITPFPSPVASVPTAIKDSWFWQFPVRTEADAHARHAQLSEVLWSDGNTLNCYVGIPWATFFDREQVDELALTVLRTRIRGFRQALAQLGTNLRVHTVCQHIKWEKILPLMLEQGITDLWASHAQKNHNYPVCLHPWSLYAVNIEDPERSAGIVVSKPLDQKRYLASFIGAHMPHYLCDVRLKIKALENQSDVLIRVNDQWHFNGIVYQHQVHSEPIELNYRIDQTVYEYNRVLSESVFSLCPSGAGPNTIRLWESLAVGSIPVLIGEEPWLPEGGTLEPIDWENVVLRASSDEIPTLLDRLRRIPIEEVRRRQQNCRKAYEKIKKQKCFQ